MGEGGYYVFDYQCGIVWCDGVGQVVDDEDYY